jgi:hypothetical protein
MDSGRQAAGGRRQAEASLPLRRLFSAAGSLLPAETRKHARASACEAVAALRSLADGASDRTERAIDRLTFLLSKR